MAPCAERPGLSQNLILFTERIAPADLTSLAWNRSIGTTGESEEMPSESNGSANLRPSNQERGFQSPDALVRLIRNRSRRR